MADVCWTNGIGASDCYSEVVRWNIYIFLASRYLLYVHGCDGLSFLSLAMPVQCMCLLLCVRECDTGVTGVTTSQAVNQIITRAGLAYEGMRRSIIRDSSAFKNVCTEDSAGEVRKPENSGCQHSH